jgi:NAD(P)-dependent dehydrogenase (short-subunit alcohol dehydrogenase family)
VTTDNPLDFTGKVVVVTGGCRGVGRGIAERFLAAGADVVVCCRNEPDALPSAGGRDAVFVAADIREPEQIDAVIAATNERFGRLDVLVNNAGGSPPADTATASPRFSTAIVNLNLMAPLVFSQRANAVMQEQPEGGVILNIGSVSGLRANPESAAYGIAKAGLVNLTETMGVSFAPKVRVVCVTAGPVVTENAEVFYGGAEEIAAVGKTIALGRMAEPADIADVCLFAASPLARYITGAQILVHGGGEKPAYMDALER